MKLAREHGDSLAQARLDRVLISRDTPSQNGETDLIGNSTPTPKGGDHFETAPELAPGFYNCYVRCEGYFKVWLRGGQALHIHLRTGEYQAAATFFDTNGQSQKPAGNSGNSQISTGEWTALTNGWHYLYISANVGAVYRISIRD